MSHIGIAVAVVGGFMTLLMFANLLNGDASMLANRILIVGVAGALGIGTLAAAGIVFAKAFS